MLVSFLNFLQYDRGACRKLLVWISNLEFEILITYLNKTFGNHLGVGQSQICFRKALGDCIAFQIAI